MVVTSRHSSGDDEETHEKTKIMEIVFELSTFKYKSRTLSI
jgi:hypothetical protein